MWGCACTVLPLFLNMHDKSMKNRKHGLDGIQKWRNLVSSLLKLFWYCGNFWWLNTLLIIHGFTVLYVLYALFDNLKMGSMQTLQELWPFMTNMLWQWNNLSLNRSVYDVFWSEVWVNDENKTCVTKFVTNPFNAKFVTNIILLSDETICHKLHQ